MDKIWELDDEKWRIAWDDIIPFMEKLVK